MRISRVVAGVVLTVVWLGTACGGDGVPDPPDDGGNNNASPMSATIDGQSWKASAMTGAATALQFAPVSGGYILTGFDVTGAGLPGTSLVFTINNISGPGTYPLGTDAVSVYGGFAGVVAANGQQWTTPLTGAAGTITVTALTTTRIAGSFNFSAAASGGGATGTRTVTNGTFDLPILGNAVMPKLPDSVGSKMSVSLNGTPWHAAIVSAGSSNGFITISGINASQTLIFTLPLPAGPGTYQLGNNPGILQAWDPNAVAPAGARCCWGVAGDVGTIRFTHLTKTRARGTLTATLSPQPGTAARGQLVISNGTFDVGLFHKP